MLALTFVASLPYGAAGGTNAWSYTDRFHDLFTNPNMLSILCPVTIPLGWKCLPAIVRFACHLAVASTAIQLSGAAASILGASWADRSSARFTQAEGGDLSSGRTPTWAAAIDVNVSQVHNSYLRWLLEPGPIGAAALLLPVVGSLRLLVRTPLTGVSPGLIWLVATGSHRARHWTGPHRHLGRGRAGPCPGRNRRSTPAGWRGR